MCCARNRRALDCRVSFARWLRPGCTPRTAVYRRRRVVGWINYSGRYNTARVPESAFAWLCVCVCVQVYTWVCPSVCELVPAPPTLRRTARTRDARFCERVWSWAAAVTRTFFPGPAAQGPRANGVGVKRARLLFLDAAASPSSFSSFSSSSTSVAFFTDARLDDPPLTRAVTFRARLPRYLRADRSVRAETVFAQFRNSPMSATRGVVPRFLSSLFGSLPTSPWFAASSSVSVRFRNPPMPAVHDVVFGFRPVSNFAGVLGSLHLSRLFSLRLLYSTME